jgi:hypothetical protein
MGRPAIVNFTSLTDTLALEGVTSIVKAERNTTVANITARLHKRVTVEASDEALFAAKVVAAVKTLEANGKVTVDGENVNVVVGKRGRPAKPKTEVSASASA